MASLFSWRPRQKSSGRAFTGGRRFFIAFQFFKIEFCDLQFAGIFALRVAGRKNRRRVIGEFFFPRLEGRLRRDVIMRSVVGALKRKKSYRVTRREKNRI
ncbi:MAG: hypothetical protein DBX55_00440 [Verrucomicrobia bacterium]|nr:MAG: hypothetical protein DBX55_00440 [Verrucomicrobiota bacterium]